MFERPSARFLDDGRRLLLQHGPIDLVVQGEGTAGGVAAAYDAAITRFASVLPELCEELPLLRSAVTANGPVPTGIVARRMHAAVSPFAGDVFITPMAAVAGSVAEEILASMCAAASLRRAYVNNGGDIALHLAAGESFSIGLVDRPDRPGLFGTSTIAAEAPVRGIATSGWRGRSFSRGIADAVTVLAASADMADAAATVIANAVDLPGHAAIERAPANAIQSDSDLGDILVTRSVAALAPAEIDIALGHGLVRAEQLRRAGLIAGVALHLQGVSQVLAPLSNDELKGRIAAHA